MKSKDLKNKPLVEAILELRWALKDPKTPGAPSDPHYRLLLGRFFERVKEEYPEHEPLPTSQIPDDMVGHLVQHRFRSGPNSWPLLQLGPGILTVNDTSGYTWQNFHRRCESAVSSLVSAHPAVSDLQVEDLTLRYIDAVSLDPDKEDVFQFMRSKMKTTMELPESLFSGVEVSRVPAAFNWQVSFPHKRPEGMATLRFAMGQVKGKPALVWETLIVSQGEQVPKIPDQVSQWLNEAHETTGTWFFKLIEGDLERRFSGG